MGWILIDFALLNTLYKCKIHRFFDFLEKSAFKPGLLFLRKRALFSNIDIHIIINLNIEDYKRYYLLFIRYSLLGILYWLYPIVYWPLLLVMSLQVGFCQVSRSGRGLQLTLISGDDAADQRELKAVTAAMRKSQ